MGFRVTDDPGDFNWRVEYISKLVDRKYEYRAVFVRGKHVCTYRKDVPAGTSSATPWNHAAGARFVTTNPQTCRLNNTFIYDALRGCPVVKHASICVADILLEYLPHASYPTAYVCELNMCPGVQLENTLLDIISTFNCGANNA